MEQHVYRPYALSPRGQLVYADIPDKRFAPRISVIAAYNQGQLLAPLRFEGHTNTALVETWAQHCLIPCLSAGQIVILDNAAFHKSLHLRTLIEKAGCQLWFQPAYSPDLNKIEHQWATLKKGIRSNTDNLDFIDKLDHQLIKMSNP